MDVQLRSSWLARSVHQRGRLIAGAALFVLASGATTPLYAKDVAQCQAACPADCKNIQSGGIAGNAGRTYAQCLVQCKANCASSAPPTVTVIQPRYLIIALLYAPPGCSGTNGTQCGNYNLGDAGSSLVDYGSGSSIGNKVSAASSFKEGLSISVDGGVADPAISFGASYAATYSNSNSTSVTQATNSDIKVYGNGDGIDHGQDQFVLLLDANVTLTQQGNNVRWKLDSGDPYTVYVSELRNPSKMRPSVAAQLKALGFTNNDYQTILSKDPYGGQVCPTNPNGITPICLAGATGAVGDSAPAPSDSPYLDPKRFAQTTWTFPYEPPLQSPNCANGVCTCDIFSRKLTNDLLQDIQVGLEQDYGVEIKNSVGVAGVFSLKSDLQFTWTSTSTNDNITDASKSAQVNVACPSINYTDPRTFMQVWWDSLYGSFLFIPIQVSAKGVVHRGTVTDASGKGLAGQLVELTYGNKTFHTFTSQRGTYQFIGTAGTSTQGKTGTLVVGKSRRTVTLGNSAPIAVKL